ncbi:MAG: tRNA (adenosine(37)-N6)-dimethylallyltransferase MiaA [Fidelibacterota bacterium]
MLYLGRDMKGQRILTIIGPTASGKTTLAVKVAKELDAEIIGLDSRQIYKGMAIGTAQPSKLEMNGVKHHLISCLEPSVAISAGEYSRKVYQKIEEVKQKGKLPILCGGAGLYYRALVKGLFEHSSSNIKIRKDIEADYDHSPKSLLEKLQMIDPEYSKIVHINNKQRLVRALEIHQITGVSPSDHFKNQEKNRGPFLNTYSIYLEWDRAELQKRIISRTKKMIMNGWVDETKKLVKKQDAEKKVYPALSSIGYQQIDLFLNGQKTLGQLEEAIIINTRQYAKRQAQWFKKERIDLVVEMKKIKLSNLSEIISCIIKSLQ